MSKFTISEAVQYGWDTTLQNLGILIAVVAVGWVIPYIPSAISAGVGRNSSIIAGGISLIFSILGAGFSLIIQIGLIKVALKIHDGQAADFSDLFSHAHLFLKFLLGSILYAMVILAGMILLIVPGIVWAVKYQFLPYLIVDRELGPMGALRKSGEITEGFKWDIFALDLALAGINLAGAIFTCGLGLLLTIPISMMTTAYVYRRLAGNNETQEAEQALSMPGAIG